MELNSDSIKILLIEDKPSDARLVQDKLSSETSFNIEIVNKLQDGLKKIKENKIDLILSDLGLPDSDGINTFIKLYEIAKHIPIVILSGINDKNLPLKAVSLGAQDYLVKGEFDSKLLSKTIKFAIERHKNHSS